MLISSSAISVCEQAVGHAAEEEAVPSRERYPYVLVMERGERSLFHVLASERIAGAALRLCGHVAIGYKCSPIMVLFRANLSKWHYIVCITSSCNQFLYA